MRGCDGADLAPNRLRSIEGVAGVGQPVAIGDDGGMESPSAADLAGYKYVSFTTFRKSGEPVATPVWIAPLPDGRLGFTTSATSGKAKRLRHTSRVTLQQCGVRGTVDESAPIVEATAHLHTDPETMRIVTRAIVRKYGLQARGVLLWESLGARFARLRGKPSSPRGVVTITDARD